MPTSSADQRSRDFLTGRYRRYHVLSAEDTVCDEISGVTPLAEDEISWSLYQGWDTEAEAREQAEALYTEMPFLSFKVRDNRSRKILLRLNSEYTR